MDISNYLSLGSLIVAFLALAFSIFADRRSKRLDLQIKENQLNKEKREEENQKKADIGVNIVEIRQSNVLRFYNKGFAEARNICISIPSDSEDRINLMIDEGFLPYPKLLANQKFDISYLDYSRKAHQTISITWDDEFAKTRMKEIILDFNVL